eukprot:9629649-Karenia_brevis.AAC.1
MAYIGPPGVSRWGGPRMEEYRGWGGIHGLGSGHTTIGDNVSLAKYVASGGQLMMTQETQEGARVISEEGARQLRYAAMLTNEVAYCKMDAIGLEEVVFSPGERGVLPLKWNGKILQEVSTHPEAPVGLKVLPGPCLAIERFSVVVENESLVTERDFIA